MEKGSLIMLAKSLHPKEIEEATRLGIQVPVKDEVYTVKEGPYLSFCRKAMKSKLAIKIEELGSFSYSASFFIEIQQPMVVNLEALLAT